VLCSIVIAGIACLIAFPVLAWYLAQESPSPTASNDQAPIVYLSSPGQFTTAKVDGDWQMISPSGSTIVLRGVNLAGMDSGTRRTTSGAGSFLWFSAFTNKYPSTDKSIFVGMMYNVMQTFADEWGTNVVRIPICSRSALRSLYLCMSIPHAFYCSTQCLGAKLHSNELPRAIRHDVQGNVEYHNICSSGSWLSQHH
jgi:hypothetical protein